MASVEENPVKLKFRRKGQIMCEDAEESSISILGYKELLRIIIV